MQQDSQRESRGYLEENWGQETQRRMPKQESDQGDNFNSCKLWLYTIARLGDEEIFRGPGDLDVLANKVVGSHRLNVGLGLVGSWLIAKVSSPGSVRSYLFAKVRSLGSIASELPTKGQNLHLASLLLSNADHQICISTSVSLARTLGFFPLSFSFR